MLYLNDDHLRRLGIDWPRLREIVEATLALLGGPDVVQPLKPYLRYRDPANRIIAMPAFVGGDANVSGIKWIASFPGNVKQGLPRAHGTIVLNDTATGAPVAIVCGGLLNEFRTAAVSAAMLRAYLSLNRRDKYRIGVIGWGPIGRRQLEMALDALGERTESVRLYDRRGIVAGSAEETSRSLATICASWQDAYRESDIVITGTSATERYIDLPPLPGALLLNVSLRDYLPSAVRAVKAVVIDDWREACRENTDIEMLHLREGLTEERAITLKEAVHGRRLKGLDPGEPIFFNPMGMAAFDMAIAAYYWREAERRGIGIRL